MPGGPYVSSDPRWAVVREKDRVDHNWEWSMPISFYGRVVDQDDHPIPGAKIEFGWTDLSPAGSSAKATSSAADGTFSLLEKKGRVLEVDVSKEGFYKVRAERLKSFDYAGFWEANYYEPDPFMPEEWSTKFFADDFAEKDKPFCGLIHEYIASLQKGGSRKSLLELFPKFLG